MKSKERLLPWEIYICIQSIEEDSAEHGNRTIRDSAYSIRQQKKNKKENK